MTWLLVALGAGAGSAARFTLAHVLDRRWPTGTLIVNVAGSFLLGILGAQALSGDAMALLGTGFCGGLTTFSALMLQTAERGRRIGAGYLVTTIIGSLLACWFGFVIAA